MLLIAGILVIVAAALTAVGYLAVRQKKRKALVSHAQVLIGWGDNKGAAKDLLEAGRWSEAADLFVKAGLHLEAAKIRLGHGQADKALDALDGAPREEIEEAGASLAQNKRLETPEAQRRLAELAAKAGAYEMAIRLFDCLGDKDGKRASQLAAAQMLSNNGRHLEAAALYKELGEMHNSARERFEAARTEQEQGNRQSLARMAADEFLSLGDLDGAVNALMTADDLDRATELLVEHGQNKRAAALLEQKGQWIRASQLYEKDGDIPGAARALKEAGELKKAAEILEKSGDMAEAAQCMAMMSDMKSAGILLLRGGDLKGALEYFAILDDHELPAAARCLFDFGQIKSAVNLLVRRNQIRTAADLLNEHGYDAWASELLAQLGDRFEQAKLMKSRRQFEEAAALMMELEKFEDAYVTLKEAASELSITGTALLARVALRIGKTDEAISIYSSLLESGAAPSDRMEILYGLSRAYESAGKIFEATASLQEILCIDSNFRDAALRLRLLTGKAGSSQVPFALPGTGSGSAGSGSGTVLPARYRILSEAGRGSMGVVYRAVDEQLSRTVAIKILDQQSGGGAKMREYFLREARAVAQLNHPNIVTVYDAGLQDTTPWLVMELVEGDDLRTRFQKDRPSDMHSMKICSQVAAALDCAHARGIVHRDLKPENIMVGKDGNTKLMDFGIAYVMRMEAKDDARKNTVVGTPVYMAPEQIRGEAIDGRVDIYALGVVLFECFCGCLPFDPDAAMYHNANTPAPDPRNFRPDLDPELSEIILQCLAKSPEQRPQKAIYIEKTLKRIGARLSNKGQRWSGS